MSRSLEAIRHTRVGGIRTACISLADLIDLMLRDAGENRANDLAPKLCFDSNGQAVSMYHTDPAYREAVDSADIVHADGFVIVGSSGVFSSERIPDRSSTTDLFLDCLPKAAALGTKFFILGGKESTNFRCVEICNKAYPALDIVGRHHGYFDRDEEGEIVDLINRSGADVLWVGLGKPIEQYFAVRNQRKLKVGWIVTCGGLFNFVTGEYPRAPVWMQRSGLEWLHRLITNPRKLFWRYLKTNPHALWLIWRDRKANGSPRMNSIGS